MVGRCCATCVAKGKADTTVTFVYRQRQIINELAKIMSNGRLNNKSSDFSKRVCAFCCFEIVDINRIVRNKKMCHFLMASFSINNTRIIKSTTRMYSHKFILFY